MKFIEDCRDKYLNEEIWIIGCGPSLDSFPDDFFAKKITIALNWAIIGFPNSTYWFCPRAEAAIMMRFTHESIMEKGIFLFPFVPFPNWELTEEESLKILGSSKDKAMFMRWRRLDFDEKLFKRYLGGTIKSIAQKQKCLYLGFTAHHCAIQAAAVMGAKKITLIGCEGKYSEYPSHAQRRGMSYFYAEKPNFKYRAEELKKHLEWEKVQKNGTKALVKAFDSLEVTVQEFYYGQGYRQI